ncbi:MAG: ribonuclease III domain-containing protein [Fodinibius sp.]|nr:ribonuclease III domain-containing protein [Fodinibius sp.]
MLDKLRSFFETEAKHFPEHEERIKELESIIDFSVNDPGIFLQALRHRSTIEDDHFSSSDSYERLEFLGDAVLDLIVTEVIFDLYPEKDEGFLTKLRAKLVRGDSLAMFSRKLQLQDLILLGKRV